MKIEEQNLNEPQKPQLNIGAVRRSVTITFPLDIAETLQALIDSSIGTSDNDDFNEQMAIVLKKLDKAVSKHYA